VPHKDPEARREYHRAYMARYRAEHGDEDRQYHRQWRAANPGVSAGYSRRWYERNRERLLAHEAELERQRRDGRTRTREARYRAEHPERYVERNRRRRDRMGGLVVTERDKRRLLSRYCGNCAYCGTQKATTWDHVIPLKRGGRHSIGNLLPACLSCNLRKGVRVIVECHEIRGGDTATRPHEQQPLGRPTVRG
jgi:5-methylcytosine-specific restriction endonuclease McrA